MNLLLFIIVLFLFYNILTYSDFLITKLVSFSVGEKFLQIVLNFIIGLREQLKIIFNDWTDGEPNIINSEQLQLVFRIDTFILQFLNKYFVPYNLISPAYIKDTVLILPSKQIIEKTDIEKFQAVYIQKFVNKPITPV